MATDCSNGIQNFCLSVSSGIKISFKHKFSGIAKCVSNGKPRFLPVNFKRYSLHALYVASLFKIVFQSSSESLKFGL